VTNLYILVSRHHFGKQMHQHFHETDCYKHDIPVLAKIDAEVLATGQISTSTLCASAKSAPDHATGRLQ